MLPSRKPLFLPLLFVSSFFFFFFVPLVFAQTCNPPADYSGCPEQNPDINNSVWNPQPISGNYDYFNFGHPVDPQAPQLTGLIQNNPLPTITGLYQPSNFQRPDFIDLPQDYAPLVGLGTNPGQAIQVPGSGYDIGQGYQVQVLYADSNNITINYSATGTVAVGYTIHISGIQVNPEILRLYQEANAAGRTQLPALAAFETLGIALGGEIIVGIRDTGTLMDLRWLNDWWHTIYDPTTPIPPELLALLFPTLYDQCRGSSDRTTFRPDPYGACTEDPDLSVLDQGFATTFEAYKRTRFNIDEFGECGGTYYASRDWGGNVLVHMEEPYLPFAGYGDSDNIPQAETKYLADYFDGTAFYDGGPYDITNPQDVKRAFLEVGVFRKLTPQDQQDQVRCLMVRRARQSGVGQAENPVHDYTIKFNGESQKLTAFSCPPDKVGTEAYANWRQNTLSGRLWPAVPVTTRDDYPGIVNLSVQSPPGFLDNPGPHKISVPHMARLEEITGLVKKAVLSRFSLHSVGLTSASPPTSTSDQSSTTGPLLASASQVKSLAAQNSTSKSPKFLAQGDTGYLHISGNYTGCADLPDGNVQLNYDFKYTETAPSGGCHFQPTVNGVATLGGWVVTDEVTTPDGFVYNYNLPPVILNPGESTDITASVAIMADECAAGPTPATTCTFSYAGGGCGEVTSSCNATGDFNIGPTCGNPNFYTPPDREEDAITDNINPPNLDHMRETPITARLTVLGYQVGISQSDYDSWRRACDEALATGIRIEGACNEDFTMSRKIGVDVWFPYMRRTWEQTAFLDTAGLFHIFTPGPEEDFEEKWAKDKITFGFQDRSGLPGKAGADPSEGWLYFPYLGGVQLAKECIVNQILCAADYSGCNPAASCPPFK